MKKHYFLGVLLCASLVASAQTISYDNTNPETKAQVSWTANQDMHVFRTIPTGKQVINSSAPLDREDVGDTVKYNYISFPTWKVSCLVPEVDFKGQIDEEKSLIKFPKYGEITSLFLWGVNTQAQTIKITSYVKPTMLETLASKKYSTFPDYELTGKVSETEYCEVPASREDEADEEYGYVDTLLFKSNFIKPYTYRGGNVSVDILLENTIDVDFAMNTMTVTPAIPTVYRGDGDIWAIARCNKQIVSKKHLYNFDPVFAGTYVYNLPAEFLKEHGVELVDEDKYNLNYLGLREHDLPAYGLNYYTNDIRIKATGVDGNPITKGEVRLFDKTTGENVVPKEAEAASAPNAVKMNEDGTFAYVALNPDDTYELAVNSTDYGQVTIKDLTFTPAENGKEKEYNDIVVNIVFDKSIVTGVEKLQQVQTVESVRYYNMAGVESHTPLQGVNVVVTTYADGTKQVSKQVVK